MITLKDVRIAVNKQLKKTGIEINSRDVEEGFNRPSFFVQINNVGRHGTETQIERMLSINIYYFPSDRYEYAIEVLEMQETLEDLFDLKLRIKDRHLNVDEFNTFLNDGVLNCSFDIEFFDGRKKSWQTEEDEEHELLHPIEKMEELDIEINKE